MPKDRAVYYNRIDMGIFILFLELILKHNNIDCQRALFNDHDDINEYTLCTEYRILC